jgi:hypothetical protein
MVHVIFYISATVVTVHVAATIRTCRRTCSTILFSKRLLLYITLVCHKSLHTMHVRSLLRAHCANLRLARNCPSKQATARTRGDAVRVRPAPGRVASELNPPAASPTLQVGRRRRPADTSKSYGRWLARERVRDDKRRHRGGDSRPGCFLCTHASYLGTS